MEPEDGGQQRWHSCSFSTNSCRSALISNYNHNYTYNNQNLSSASSDSKQNSDFSSVQIVKRKRRRGGGCGEDKCLSSSENQNLPHQRDHRCQRRMSSSLMSSYPLVFTLLVFLLASLIPGSVHTLPLEGTSLMHGGSGSSHRSHLDLLIDPIHQAEFSGDEDTLDSKRVVKSVFDMVLRTPPPPTSSASRCPPGTQSPFEGGPCIKKSTDPVALVDQSFILEQLRGLAEKGDLLAGGGRKNKRPGSGGGGRRRTSGRPSSAGSRTTTTTPPPPPSTMPTDTTSPTTLTSIDEQEQVTVTTTITIEPEPTQESQPETLATTIVPRNEEEKFGQVHQNLSESEETSTTTDMTVAATTIITTEQHFGNNANKRVGSITINEGGSPIDTDEGEISPKITTMTDNGDDADPLSSNVFTTPVEMVTLTNPNPSANPSPSTEHEPTFTKEEFFTVEDVTNDKDMISQPDNHNPDLPVTETTMMTGALKHSPEKSEFVDPSGNEAEEMKTTVTGVNHSGEEIHRENSGKRADDGSMASSSSLKFSFQQINDDEGLTSKTTTPTTIIGGDGEAEVKQISENMPLVLSMNSPDEKDSTDDNEYADLIAATIAMFSTSPPQQNETPTQNPFLSLEESEEKSPPRVEEATLADELLFPDTTNKVATTPSSSSSPSPTPLSLSGVEQEPLINDDGSEPVSSTDEESLREIKRVTTTAPAEAANLHLNNNNENEKKVLLTKEEPFTLQMEQITKTGDMQMNMTGRKSQVLPEEEEIHEDLEKNKNKRVIEEEGDGHPSVTVSSSPLPVVNHFSTEEAEEEEKKETVIVHPSKDETQSEPEQPDTLALLQENNNNESDLLIINNPTVSPAHHHHHQDHEEEVVAINKDKEILALDEIPSSREDEHNQSYDELTPPQQQQDEEEPATTLVPPTTPLQQQKPFIPRDTLLQFQLPIVTRGPVQRFQQQHGINDFEKFPDFPSASPIPTSGGKVRFPAEEDNVPVEGGVSGYRGTFKPIFVQDFQLNYPPRGGENQSGHGPSQTQHFEKTKPFFHQSPTDLPEDTNGGAMIQQPEYYDTGSTEYLESELDRRHQKTRSRNRIRTPDLSTTNQPLPLELSFYTHPPHQAQMSQRPSAPAPQRAPVTHSPQLQSSHHRYQPPHNQQHQQHQQQPFYFARRNPSPDLFSFGYLNFPTGHDRFANNGNNNRRLIW